MSEQLAHPIRRPGAGSIESFLRGIELVHDQQRLAACFLESTYVSSEAPQAVTVRTWPLLAAVVKFGLLECRDWRQRGCLRPLAAHSPGFPVMGHKKIPVSVVVIACLYLTVGMVGLVAHFDELRAPDGIWVEVTESLAIVCGVFLLRAQNWARWLAIAWMAFHVAISVGALTRLAIHSLFLVLIVWSLFHADADRFFRKTEMA